jgi:lactoylglutathione lyase
MLIEHIAIWTENLEPMRAFYETYFQGKAGNKYQNNEKQFESFFISFSSGAQLELMSLPGIIDTNDGVDKQFTGYTHMCFSCGSENSVDEMTERLQTDGYQVVRYPRRTGDGYYESVVLDPDGNRIEITV